MDGVVDGLQPHGRKHPYEDVYDQEGDDAVDKGRVPSFAVRLLGVGFRQGSVVLVLIVLRVLGEWCVF